MRGASGRRSKQGCWKLRLCGRALGGLLCGHEGHSWRVGSDAEACWSRVPLLIGGSSGSTEGLSIFGNLMCRSSERLRELAQHLAVGAKERAGEQ